MADPTEVFDVPDTGPEYVVWRSDGLAEAALVFVPELTVLQRRAGRGYDMVAMTEDGLFLQFIARGYSSMRLKVRDVAAVPVLRWSLEAAEVRRARASPNPVFLFLMDADRMQGDGRYVRLDTMPAPAARARTVRISFPRENTTDPEGIRRMVAGVRASRQPSAA